jgi:hypothetical protein
MQGDTTKVFCLDRFRAEFNLVMAKVRRHMSELERASEELHRNVTRFCRL